MTIFDIESNISTVMADAVAIQKLSVQAEECMPLEEAYLCHAIYTLSEDQLSLEESITDGLVGLRTGKDAGVKNELFENKLTEIKESAASIELLVNETLADPENSRNEGLRLCTALMITKQIMQNADQLIRHVI